MGATMKTFKIAIAFAITLLAGTAFADEQTIKLKPGAGVDKVEANCGACHSLAYIPMNSPFLKPAAWDAEIGKMIKAFGAPIDDADAKDIAGYLKKNYGG
jgi:mono/diheme cytochrome c family protein